jgi:hypothetical protein
MHVVNLSHLLDDVMLAPPNARAQRLERAAERPRAEVRCRELLAMLLSRLPLFLFLTLRHAHVELG